MGRGQLRLASLGEEGVLQRIDPEFLYFTGIISYKKTVNIFGVSCVARKSEV